MKVFLLVVAALFPLVLSGPAPPVQVEQEDEGANVKHLVVETSPGVYEVEDLINDEINTMASETDLVYHFFNQRDPHIGVDIVSTNVEALRNTRFSNLRDTVFIIHGWKDDNDSALSIETREAILTKNNVNVFAVDWGPIADRNYISAKNSVVQVGRFVAGFIQSLVDRFGLRLDKLAFVGFSLGAHIAGNAGAALNGEVEHIVGLDPAGPLFSVRNIDERLDPTDGKFVQVIHTNGGVLGFSHPSGHSDYYPNGGSSQAGCGLDLFGACAHARAFAYYTEAILAGTNLFVSEICASYSDFTRGRCVGNVKSVMGGYKVDIGAAGNYYLDTNSQSPFARG